MKAQRSVNKTLTNSTNKSSANKGASASTASKATSAAMMTSSSNSASSSLDTSATSAASNNNNNNNNSSSQFMKLVDYRFSDNHLIIEHDFNSWKLAAATFQQSTSTSNGNTNNNQKEEYICGDLVGKGAFSKVYEAFLSSSSSSSNGNRNNNHSEQQELALRLTSSNILARLNRENEIMDLIQKKQSSCPASSPINQHVVRVFGGGVLPATKSLISSSSSNTVSTPAAIGGGLINNHAFSAIQLLELLRSETLYSFMRSNGGALTIVDVYEIMLQCAQSISEIHKLGIVHRDVKLENFVFSTTRNNNNSNSETATPKIKLIDFGTAATVSPTSQHTNLPQDELTCGTPTFMAVEMARNAQVASTNNNNNSSSVRKQQLTRAVDCWALGIIFYSLFTMTSPWSLDHKPQQQNNNNSSHQNSISSISSNSRQTMFPITPATSQAGINNNNSNNKTAIQLHRIVNCDWHWPTAAKQKTIPNMTHPTANDAKLIIAGLLTKDPQKRMTADQLVLKLKQLIAKVDNGMSNKKNTMMMMNKENGANNNNSTFGTSSGNRSGALSAYFQMIDAQKKPSLLMMNHHNNNRQKSTSDMNTDQDVPPPPSRTSTLLARPPIAVSTAMATKKNSSISSGITINKNNDNDDQLLQEEKKIINSKSRKSVRLPPPAPAPAQPTKTTEDAAPVEVAAVFAAPPTTARTSTLPLEKSLATKLNKEYTKERNKILAEESEAWEMIPWLHTAQLKQAKHAHNFKKKILKVDDIGEGFICDLCMKMCSPPKNMDDLNEHKKEFCSMHCSCDMDVCLQCFDTYIHRRTCQYCSKKFSWLKDIADHTCKKMEEAKKIEETDSRRRNRDEVNDDENDDQQHHQDQKENKQTKTKTSTGGRGRGRRSAKVVAFTNNNGNTNSDEDNDDDALKQDDDGVTRAGKRGGHNDDDDEQEEKSSLSSAAVGPQKPSNDADRHNRENEAEAAAAAALALLPTQPDLPLPTTKATTRSSRRNSLAPQPARSRPSSTSRANSTEPKKRRSRSKSKSNNNKKSSNKNDERSLNWIRRIRLVKDHKEAADCFFYTITKGRHCAMFTGNDFPFHSVITAVHKGLAWFIKKETTTNTNNNLNSDSDGNNTNNNTKQQQIIFTVEKVDFDETRRYLPSHPYRRAIETCKTLAIEENLYSRSQRSIEYSHDSIASSCFSTEKDSEHMMKAGEELPIEFITDVFVDYEDTGCMVMSLNDGRRQTLGGKENPKFELHGYTAAIVDDDDDDDKDENEDKAAAGVVKTKNIVELFDGLDQTGTAIELKDDSTNTVDEKSGHQQEEDAAATRPSSSSLTAFERELADIAKKLGFRF